MRVQNNRRRRRVLAETNVASEAADMLFEVEDVAELIAEITGEEVEVTADDTTASFEVGEEVFTVEADGSEEVVESSSRIAKRRRPVKASSRRNGRAVRRIPRRK